MADDHSIIFYRAELIKTGEFRLIQIRAGDPLHVAIGRLLTLAWYVDRSGRFEFSELEIDRIAGWNRADLSYSAVLAEAGYLVNSRPGFVRLKFPKWIGTQNGRRENGKRKAAALTRGYAGRFQKADSGGSTPKPRHRITLAVDADGNPLPGQPNC